jgi:hypothetical protein
MRFVFNNSGEKLRQNLSPISQKYFGPEMSHLRGCSTSHAGGPSEDACKRCEDACNSRTIAIDGSCRREGEPTGAMITQLVFFLGCQCNGSVENV